MPKMLNLVLVSKTLLFRFLADFFFCASAAGGAGDNNNEDDDPDNNPLIDSGNKAAKTM
jgi:hypothetical protein